MLKKLIKSSISFTAFSTILIPTINETVLVNQIYYSDAVKKVNDVRSKIDIALETLTEISNGIDKYRDALSPNVDLTNYEFYEGRKPYIFYKSVCRGKKHESIDSNSSYAKPCKYKLFDEEIFLNPYYVTDVSAQSYYVITSWAGNSWQTMGEWFTDSSVEKYQIYKSFSGEIFYICSLNHDKEEIRLTGMIDIEKPNASIYMNVKIESSEKSKPVIKTRDYMKGHTGWAIFDWELLKGTIMYNITDQSKTKLQRLKQRIADLKIEVKSELDKLNNYNPEVDRNNNDYENSNLKQLLDNCEKVYSKAISFINLKNSNGWMQKF